MQNSINDTNCDLQREPNTNFAVETPKVPRIEVNYSAIFETESGEILSYLNPNVATILNIYNDKEELRNGYMEVLEQQVKIAVKNLFNKVAVSVVITIDKIDFINF